MTPNQVKEPADKSFLYRCGLYSYDPMGLRQKMPEFQDGKAERKRLEALGTQVPTWTGG